MSNDDEDKKGDALISKFKSAFVGENSRPLCTPSLGAVMLESPSKSKHLWELQDNPTNRVSVFAGVYKYVGELHEPEKERAGIMT